MIMLLLTAAQGPFVVNVKVAVPAAISAALGVYMAFSVVLPGAKVPVPPLHVAEVADPPMVPFRVAALPAQIDWSGPAFTVAGGLMEMMTLSVTAAHGPVVVKIKVTVPAVTSAALGVYTAFKVVLLGAKVPEPPDQVPDVAEPPMTPFKVAVPPEHIA